MEVLRPRTPVIIPQHQQLLTPLLSECAQTYESVEAATRDQAQTAVQQWLEGRSPSLEEALGQLEWKQLSPPPSTLDPWEWHSIQIFYEAQVYNCSGNVHVLQ